MGYLEFRRGSNMMWSSVRATVGLVVVVVTLAPGSDTTAGEPAGAGQGRDSFEESIAVHEVRIRVRVDNGLGLPVSGLTIEDFQVNEDGNPVDIVDFRVLQQGEIVPDAPWLHAKVAENELGTDRTVTPAAATVREPELVVILTDFQMIRPRFVTAMGELLAWVDTHHQEIEQRTWMVGFVDRTVGLLGGPTSEPKELRAKLEDLSRRNIQGRIWRFMESPGTSSGGPRARIHAAAEGSIANEDDPRQRMLDRQGCSGKRSWMLGQIEALTRLVESLAPVPGKKSVIWMHSRSIFPQREGCKRSDIVRVIRSLSELGALASSAGVVFHASSMAGLELFGLSGVITEQNMGTVQPASFERLFSLGSVATLLAYHTGGQKIGLNDPSWIFHRAFKDSVYELTVLVPRGPDGQEHKIKVDINEGYPLALLRYPRSYLDLSKKQLLMNQLQRMSMLPGSYGAFPVHVSHQEVASGNEVSATLTISVPAMRIGLIDDGEHNVARLEPYISVHSLDGTLIEFRELDSSNFSLNKTTTIGPKSAFQASAEIDVPPGEYMVNGAFYDALNDAAGVTSARIEFGKGNQVPQ